MVETWATGNRLKHSPCEASLLQLLSFDSGIPNEGPCVLDFCFSTALPKSQPDRPSSRVTFVRVSVRRKPLPVSPLWHWASELPTAWVSSRLTAQSLCVGSPRCSQREVWFEAAWPCLKAEFHSKFLLKTNKQTAHNTVVPCGHAAAGTVDIL